MRKAIVVSVMVVVAIGVVWSTCAFAMTPRGVSFRIANQQTRINEGIRNGQLTPNEAAIVQDNLDRIRARFARSRADGVLTSRELSILGGLLQRNNQMIYNKKHNYRRMEF
jgi:hypothetical protein